MLTRGGESTALPINALLASGNDLLTWAQSAPKFRLERLLFASNGREVFITGDPLPPIPGTRFQVDLGVAIPCGFNLSPRIDTASFRNLLRLHDKDVAVLLPREGAVELEIVASSEFVQATRASMRGTFIASWVSTTMLPARIEMKSALLLTVETMFAPPRSSKGNLPHQTKPLPSSIPDGLRFRQTPTV